jgi:hypothetical protein
LKGPGHPNVGAGGVHAPASSSRVGAAFKAHAAYARAATDWPAAGRVRPLWTRRVGDGWRPSNPATGLLSLRSHIHYYAVDHSPSHLWNSATWEISDALMPYLRPVLAGPKAWGVNQTIQRAIEIRDGVIQNPRILSFQHRSPQYPHPRH